MGLEGGGILKGESLMVDWPLPDSVCLDGGYSFKDNDPICKVGCHYEVMLNNKGCLLRMEDEPIAEDRLP